MNRENYNKLAMTIVNDFFTNRSDGAILNHHGIVSGFDVRNMIEALRKAARRRLDCKLDIVAIPGNHPQPSVTLFIRPLAGDQW